MTKKTSLRSDFMQVSAVTFTQDLTVEWDEPLSDCEVCLAWECVHGEGRLMLWRRDAAPAILGFVGDKPSLKMKVTLQEGDKVVLQWRALTPSTPASSEVAELSVKQLPKLGEE